MMGQADRVAGGVPQENLTAVEAPSPHVRWVVKTVEGRTGASLAVVG